MSKAVAIGLSNLVYAIMVSDTPPTAVGAGDGAALYDSSVRVLGAISATFSPNASNDTMFADDGPYETASTLGAMTLELNVADIPPEQRAELLGATYNTTTGGLSHSSDDIPPYVAVGMAVKKSNGSSRYIWYLKGKFSMPDDNNQTKADSVNWNTPTITGNFLKRDADNKFRDSIETDDLNVKQATVDAWFTNPNVLSMASVAAITATPASGGSVTAGTTTIVLASATPDAIIEYKKTGDTEWTPYSTAIATTGWTGSVIISARATKTGLLPTSGIFTYTIA